MRFARRCTRAVRRRSEEGDAADVSGGRSRSSPEFSKKIGGRRFTKTPRQSPEKGISPRLLFDEEEAEAGLSNGRRKTGSEWLEGLCGARVLSGRAREEETGGGFKSHSLSLSLHAVIRKLPSTPP